MFVASEICAFESIYFPFVFSVDEFETNHIGLILCQLNYLCYQLPKALKHM